MDSELHHVLNKQERLAKRSMRFTDILLNKFYDQKFVGH